MIRPARLFVRLLTLAALLALIVFLPLTPAGAETYKWNVGSGDWNTSGNWYPNGVPDTDDNAIIDNGGTANISTGNPATAKNLTVGESNSNEGYVNHSGNTLTVGQNLTIGANEGSYGAYYLYYLTGDPSSFILNVGQNLIVGHAGSGYFEQSGGKVTVGHDLILGNQTSDSYGEYSISETPESSILNVTGYLIVGNAGSGYFVQSGGQVTVGHDLILGNQTSDSYGKYFISGTPESSILNVTGYLIVGNAGYGDFYQNSGTVTVDHDLILGKETASVGVYDIYKKGNYAPSLEVKGNLIVGHAGSGYFGQSGGTVTVDHDLILGYQAGSSGEYYFDYEGYNTSTLEVTGNLIVGHAGYGYFYQSGGTVTVGQDLILGNQAGSSGSYIFFAWGANTSSLEVKGNLIVGKAGWSYFKQSGGTVTVGQKLIVGDLTTEQYDGYYKLSGDPGSSKLTVGQDLILGNGNGESGIGVGYFEQTGGAVTVGRDLILGDQAGSYGNYFIYQETGLPQLTVTGNIFVGNAGSGEFEQDGSAVTVTQSLVLGNQSSSIGKYYLDEKNGSAVLGITGNLIVGSAGSGEFTHSAGTITAREVLLGLDTAGVGSYLLQGGTLTAQSLGVGFAGRGDFSQDGGEVNLNYLEVGALAGSTGRYQMSDGSLTITPKEPWSPSITLGRDGAKNGTREAQGTFELSGTGTINAPVMSVGAKGTGTFIQSGGEVSLNYLEVGAMAGSTGRYQMSGGSLTITAGDWSPSITLGRDGAINGTREAQGTFELIGGEVTAPMVIVGLRGQGTFTQSGGKLQVNGLLAVNGIDDGNGNNTQGSGSFTQTGGTATIANLTNYDKVNIDNTSGNIVSTYIGSMTNYGKVTVTSATVTFTNYTEHGSYTSDPATTIILVNLDVKESGYLVGGTGDTWQIGNDFLNTSTQSTKWNTRNANLVFFQGPGQDTSHTLQIPSIDNYAWGGLDLTNQDLTLIDDSTPGGALYVGAIEGLLISGSTITNIHSIRGLNIYYDPRLNPELNGNTYFLDGGGVLAPAVPLPGSVWLLLTGLAGLALVARRRRTKVG
jgi:hypothetical protein